jgi:hypothetical protein
MIVPSGYSETEVLRVMNRVASTLSHRCSFGSFTPADTAQQAMVYALEALDRFDPTRLFNLKRDQFWRCDSVCPRCFDGDYCTGTAKPCEKFANWYKRNQAKANLSKPGPGGEPVQAFHLDDPDEIASMNELMLKIDEELEIELRAPYLQMRAGCRVDERTRARVEKRIRQIVGNDLA